MLIEVPAGMTQKFPPLCQYPLRITLQSMLFISTREIDSFKLLELRQKKYAPRTAVLYLHKLCKVR